MNTMPTRHHSRRYRRSSPLDPTKDTHEYHKLLPRTLVTPIQSAANHEYDNLSRAATQGEPEAMAARQSHHASSSRRPTKCYLKQTDLLLHHNSYRSDPTQRAGTIITSEFDASVAPVNVAGPSIWFGDDEPIWVEIVNGVMRDIPPSQARTRASGLYGGEWSGGAQADTKRSKRNWFRRRSERNAQSSRLKPAKSG